MNPFHVSGLISGHYPSAEIVAQAASRIQENEVKQFLRLWVTEGIPFAFFESPMIYEAVREWMAKDLGVNPKLITLVGSARIGYSLSPHPTFGKAFNKQSDLDFVVISDTLFNELVSAFELFKLDYTKGLITPKNENENKYWDENIIRLPKNISKGFINSNKIPNYPRYEKAQHINKLMYKLINNLNKTPKAPICYKASVRVYKNWDAFTNQLGLNLSEMFKSLKYRNPSLIP